MATPDVLDFAQLTSPIPGDHPTGIDLRSDAAANSLYYAIRDARQAARAAERLAQANGETSTADWKPVMKLVPQVLVEKSKDLEMTAYFIEALVRKHGFAGVRDGYRLVRELVNGYWDNLFPMPDEDGLETRVAGLGGLTGGDSPGTLIEPIESMLLTKGSSCGPYTYAHFRQAVDLGSLEPDKQEARKAQGAVSMEMFERAVAETPSEFYVELMSDLDGCVDEFGRVSELLDEKCGGASPASSNLKGLLFDIRDSVLRFAKAKLPSTEVAEEGAAAAQGNGTGAAAGGGGGGPMRTRDDAFRQLAQIADFFRRTEPHSPIPYALERVVRWGAAPLPQLLMELIPDMNARGEFCKVVGIPPDQNSSGY